MAAAMTKEERMGSAPIGQLMFQLALPAVAAQFIRRIEVAEDSAEIIWTV